METRILLVKPFGTEYSAKRDSLTNECISENPVLVNTMEKIDPAEFSIQEFGSVALGAKFQTRQMRLPTRLTFFGRKTTRGEFAEAAVRQTFGSSWKEMRDTLPQ